MILARLVSLILISIPAGVSALSLRKDPVSLEVRWAGEKPDSDGSSTVLLDLKIDKGWHINSHKPKEDFLIATQAGAQQGCAWTVSEVVYPKGVEKSFEFSPTAMSIYEGAAPIRVRAVSPPASPEKDSICLFLRFQACDDRQCLPPQTLEFSLPAEPWVESTQVSSSSPLPPPSLGRAKPGMFPSLGEFKIGEFLQSQGFILTLIAVYLLGLGLCLTPCVYPVIPVTVGYFGSHAEKKLGRQFMLASAYGLGIALSYAALGTFAALSGSLFGSLLQNPWVLAAMGLLCAGLALNAFGLYEIQMPQFLLQIAGSNYPGLAGAFFMGLTMGIAAAPCVGAFVVGLLAYVGQKRDLMFGASAFFALGLGLATPFVVLATFSGLMSKLPRSGAWLVYAKQLMGGLLLAAALYFVHGLLPVRVLNVLMAGGLVLTGWVYGWGLKESHPSPLLTSLRRVLGFVLILSGAFIGGRMSAGSEVAGPDWKPYSHAQRTEARVANRPVVIDFFADWCLPCKELDRFTFSDPRVVALSRRFLALKVDLTRQEAPETADLVKHFAVKGVPTIVFLDPSGREIEDLRLVQFEGAEAMRTRMERALAVNGLSKEAP